jgi:hypothetical protein
VGTEVAVAAAGWLDALGVAAGELQAASRSNTAMRASDRATDVPCLIRSDCNVRWVALLDASPDARSIRAWR